MADRGRPRKVVCKSELVHLRVTPAQKQALLIKARATNQTLAEFVLNCCLASQSTPLSVQLSLLPESKPDLGAELPTIRFPDTIEKRAIDKQW